MAGMKPHNQSCSMGAGDKERLGVAVGRFFRNSDTLDPFRAESAV